MRDSSKSDYVENIYQFAMRSLKFSKEILAT